MKLNEHISQLKGYPTADKFEYEVGVMSNENNYGPSPRVYAAIRAINDVNRYPDPLAEKLREKLAEYNNVPSENIVCFSGGDEAIRTILGLFLSPGKTLLGHAPTFAMYPIGAQYYGAKYDAVSLEKDFSFTQKQLDAILEKSSAASAIALCNPNNPTGNEIPLELLEKLLNAVETPVLVDEAYFEYHKQTVANRAVEGKAIVVRTLSKAFGLAGLRCGYAIAPKEIAEALLKAKLVFNVNSVTQAAALAALSDLPHMHDIVEKTVADREKLFTALKEKGYSAYSSTANFVLVQDAGGELYKKLLDNKVLARQVKLPGFPPEQYVRISIGTTQENERVISLL